MHPGGRDHFDWKRMGKPSGDLASWAACPGLQGARADPAGSRSAESRFCTISAQVLDMNEEPSRKSQLLRLLTGDRGGNLLCPPRLLIPMPWASRAPSWARHCCQGFGWLSEHQPPVLGLMARPFSDVPGKPCSPRAARAVSVPVTQGRGLSGLLLGVLACVFTAFPAVRWLGWGALPFLDLWCSAHIMG